MWENRFNMQKIQIRHNYTPKNEITIWSMEKAETKRKKFAIKNKKSVFVKNKWCYYGFVPEKQVKAVSLTRVQKNTERKEKMFGKSPKHEIPDEAETTQKEKSREEQIVENIMRFTGVNSIEELEEVVNGAEKASADDEKNRNELLFGAVNTIKQDRSLAEAKDMEQNEDFVKAVLAGFSADKAFMLANFDKLIDRAFAEGEQKGKESFEVKKDRVDEEGLKVAGGYKAEIDPANMTMDDLKKIKERLRKGENVRI